LIRRGGVKVKGMVKVGFWGEGEGEGEGEGGRIQEFMESWVENDISGAVEGHKTE
jgi:hypothetical protein